MRKSSLEVVMGAVLAIYLLAVGIWAVAVMVLGFPTAEPNGDLVLPRLPSSWSWVLPPVAGSPEQQLFLLAFAAGLAGSFLHSAQSLGTYLGNAAFRPSWWAWYLLRPWVGGVLGLTIYVSLRAGLFAGSDGANPHGVVAIGMLGGWFAKTTTDKMQEVFQTMFRTNEDEKRADKLTSRQPPSTGTASPAPGLVNVPGAAGAERTSKEELAT